MKKIRILFLLLMSLLIFVIINSCSVSQLTDIEEKTENETNQEKSFLFSEKRRYMLPGDPNLNPDWDWTVNGTGHTMYYSTNGSTPVKLTHVQLPFYTAGHTLNTYEKDMYQKDGWILAYRDFGTAQSAPPFPFFALYNRYTGKFRVMLYNAPNLLHTYYMVEAKFKSSSYAGALFTFTDNNEKVFRYDCDKSKTQVYLSDMDQFNGWAFFDLTMAGYDPGLHSNAILQFKLRSVDISNLELKSKGSLTLDEILNNANPSGSKLSADNLIGAFNQGAKYYNKVEDVQKTIKDKMKNNSSKWWYSAASTLVSSGLATAAPYIGGLVGVVTSFIGGKDKAAPREPLNFKGTIEFDTTGEIKTVDNIWAVDIALNYGSQSADFYRPVRRIKWGLYNIRRKPTIQYYVATGYDSNYNKAAECYYYLDTDITYDINSSANTGMILQSIGFAYYYNNARPTAFYSAGVLKGYRFWHYWNEEDWDLFGDVIRPPSGIAVKLSYKISNPTKYADNEIVVYKTYPVNVVRHCYSLPSTGAH